MPTYDIMVWSHGLAGRCAERLFDATKADARRCAADHAAATFPGCTVRQSNDALLVRRDGEVIATVAWERVRGEGQ